AGVSRATASRVVNGSQSVEPELIARVRTAVEELNYVPNLAARALMTRRTSTIALVAAEPDTRVFGDPFFSAIVRGVSQEASRHGVQLMLAMAQGPDDLQRVERYLLGGHVDGLLMISEHGNHGMAARVSTQLPVVIGGRPLDPAIRVPFVDNDNVGGATMAARHLATLGRTRVATITGPLDMSAGVDRLAGFRRGLGRRFRPRLVENGEFTLDSGAAAMARLLHQDRAIDGVFAASDLMAIGAMATLRKFGRSVPDDVAVVGFDDIDLAALSSPSLTTIRQRTTDQGRAMVRLLLSRVAPDDLDAQDETDTPLSAHGETGDRIVLPVELVLRDSA
ncbi:MAG: LacI family transcriptional regulator, partial [Austwickia sp.]|nr:LacI family transcriptional regulator [Austwickia sp.]